MNSRFRFPVRWLLSFAAGLLSPAVAAPLGLADALSVRASLGPRASAEVIWIEHCGRGAARVSFATVFEFSGIVWLYRPERGTESLLTAGATAGERPALESLLAPLFDGCAGGAPAIARAIDADERATGLPRNGCVPAAIALLRRLAAARRVEEARLLFYYYREVVPGTAFYRPQSGHTVLLVRTGGAWRAHDVMHGREQPLGRALGEPTAAARAIERRRDRDILSARYLSVPAEEF